MRVTDFLQWLNIRALSDRFNKIEKRFDRMEQRMATNDELVARLRTATDTLAARVRTLSQGDPRFEPIIAELEAMGVDDSDPIPDPAPAPDEPAPPTTV